MRKLYSIQQKCAVSTIGQICTTAVDANPVTSLICSKHLISSTQLAKLCLTWIGTQTS